MTLRRDELQKFVVKNGLGKLTVKVAGDLWDWPSSYGGREWAFDDDDDDDASSFRRKFVRTDVNNYQRLYAMASA